jgi:hypothetical protein
LVIENGKPIYSITKLHNYQITSAYRCCVNRYYWKKNHAMLPEGMTASLTLPPKATDALVAAPVERAHAPVEQAVTVERVGGSALNPLALQVEDSKSAIAPATHRPGGWPEAGDQREHDHQAAPVHHSADDVALHWACGQRQPRPSPACPEHPSGELWLRHHW